MTKLCDYGSRNRGKATFESVGAARPNHILHEGLARMGGTKTLHVPHKGESAYQQCAHAWSSAQTLEGTCARCLALRKRVDGRFEHIDVSATQQGPSECLALQTIGSDHFIIPFEAPPTGAPNRRVRSSKEHSDGRQGGAAYNVTHAENLGAGNF